MTIPESCKIQNLPECESRQIKSRLRRSALNTIHLYIDGTVAKQFPPENSHKSINLAVKEE